MPSPFDLPEGAVLDTDGSGLPPGAVLDQEKPFSWRQGSWLDVLTRPSRQAHEQSVEAPSFIAGTVKGIPVAGAYLSDTAQNAKELADRGLAALQSVPGISVGSTAPTFGQRYEENLARQQAQFYPGAERAGEVVGAIAGGAGELGLAGKTIGKVIPRLGTTIASTSNPVLKMAPWVTGGAALNAADTAARGGSPEDIAKSAAIGAALPIGAAALGKIGVTAAKYASQPETYGALGALAAKRASSMLGFPPEVGEYLSNLSLGKALKQADPFPTADEIGEAVYNAFNRKPPPVPPNAPPSPPPISPPPMPPKSPSAAEIGKAVGGEIAPSLDALVTALKQPRAIPPTPRPLRTAPVPKPWYTPGQPRPQIRPFGPWVPPNERPPEGRLYWMPPENTAATVRPTMPSAEEARDLLSRIEGNPPQAPTSPTTGPVTPRPPPPGQRDATPEEIAMEIVRRLRGGGGGPPPTRGRQ